MITTVPPAGFDESPKLSKIKPSEIKGFLRQSKPLRDLGAFYDSCRLLTTNNPLNLASARRMAAPEPDNCV
jgi:hypothetical protein